MFKQGDIVICVDELFSNTLKFTDYELTDHYSNELQYMAQYVVDDCLDGFVSLVSMATGGEG